MRTTKIEPDTQAGLSLCWVPMPEGTFSQAAGHFLAQNNRSRCNHEYLSKIIYEPAHDKTNKMACAPSEDSDQPGRPPSLIRVFAVRMKKTWVLSYPLSASEDSD